MLQGRGLMKHSNHSEHQPDGMGYDMHEGHRKTGPKDDDHTTELNKARNAENAGGDFHGR